MKRLLSKQYTNLPSPKLNLLSFDFLITCMMVTVFLVFESENFDRFSQHPRCYSKTNSPSLFVLNWMKFPCSIQKWIYLFIYFFFFHFLSHNILTSCLHCFRYNWMSRAYTIFPTFFPKFWNSAIHYCISILTNKSATRSNEVQIKLVQRLLK